MPGKFGLCDAILGLLSKNAQSFPISPFLPHDSVGPGWVVGANEALSHSANPGYNIAVSKCELHHISYEKLKEIEETDPLLVLALYKLLAALIAKRQSITINQLATLHSIMGSAAQKHPHGRSNQSDALAAACGGIS